MNVLTTEAFAKHNRNTELSAEASTLDWAPLYAPLFFTLKSEWTGRNICMQLEETARDPEGDTMVWTYKPADSSINLTVDVFND